MKQKYNGKDRKKVLHSLLSVLFFTFVVFIFLTCASLCIGCSDDGGDHTGENWLCLIGIVLCFIKWLKDKLEL